MVLQCIYKLEREYRLRRATCEAEKPPELCKMTKAELCLWLPRFIFEIRKENGTDYSEVSVYNIFCGIQHYIRQNGNPELDFLPIVHLPRCVVL